MSYFHFKVNFYFFQFPIELSQVRHYGNCKAFWNLSNLNKEIQQGFLAYKYLSPRDILKVPARSNWVPNWFIFLQYRK